MEREKARDSSRFNKSDLAKIFAQDGAENAWNLGIIAIHGNEPQRLVVAISLEINNILKDHGLVPPVVILPSIYGERSKGILREEFPNDTGNIFISEELGTILKQTEFSPAGYKARMEAVSQRQPQVYDQVLDYLARSFSATSLDDEEREFFPNGRRLEINAGANVVASAPNEKKTHFYFPVVLSELVQGITEDKDINFTYDSQALETVLGYAQDFGKTYLTTQLGYIHTFSFKPDYDASGKILTPAPKKYKKPPGIPIENGICIMASGSGIGVDVVVRQAKRLAEQGYQIVAPTWMNLDFATKASPETVFHPGIKAVIGRAGWGILWDCQRAGKPFADISVGDYDNPEIRFNRRSIMAAGLGDAFSLRRGFVEGLIELSPRIEELNRKIEHDLNIPAGFDGERYAAEKILEAEIKRLKEAVQT